MHRDFALDLLTQGAREIVAVTWEFRVQEPFRAQGLCVSFLTDLWLCICFPPCFGVWCKFLSCTDRWSHFPCCEPCSLISFWDCCLPCVLLVVVLKFILGHCGFLICWLSFPILGLGIAAIIHCEFAAAEVP